mmetsp:Transcript_30288/g.59149  ORF Transcript_30288/g.59149 Transcript_30288/m.59149 type:complete len:277 (-) Transcript_30288:1910-2740(-)
MGKTHAANRLTFYGFRSQGGAEGSFFVADISPFCLKLLSYLVVTDTDFAYSSIVNKTKRAAKPKSGMVPYVAVQDSGEVIGDSQRIIDLLESTAATKLDAHLTPAQRAASHLLRRTLEESAYWTVGMEHRWFDKHLCKAITGPMYLGGLGLGCFEGILIGMGRKGVLKRAKGHGAGNHSKAQREAMGEQDLQAVEDMVLSLGEGPFVHGDKVTTIDCVVYAFTAQVMWTAATYPCGSGNPTANMQAGRYPRCLAHYKHFESVYGPKLREVTQSTGA